MTIDISNISVGDKVSAGFRFTYGGAGADFVITGKVVDYKGRLVIGDRYLDGAEKIISVEQDIESLRELAKKTKREFEIKRGEVEDAQSELAKLNQKRKNLEDKLAQAEHNLLAGRYR